MGKISPVSKWRTELMPKAWAMNIRMAISRGSKPKTSWTLERIDLKVFPTETVWEQRVKVNKQVVLFHQCSVVKKGVRAAFL